MENEPWQRYSKPLWLWLLASLTVSIIVTIVIELISTFDVGLFKSWQGTLLALISAAVGWKAANDVCRAYNDRKGTKYDEDPRN